MRRSLSDHGDSVNPGFRNGGNTSAGDLVYEKEDLLISGPGKYPEYNFYRMAGMAIDGKDKGEAENEAKPIDVKSLLP